MLRTSLAGLRFHAGRLALSALAIVIGVGFVTGTLVLGATMNKAFYASFAAGARNVDAAVSPAAKTDLRPGAPGAPSIPGTVLDRIGQVPGVAAVAGRVVGEAALLGPGGKVITSGPRPGAGINVPSDPALRGFTVVSGRLPASPAEALVDTSTATDEHFRVGQSIRVVDSTGTVRAFRLVGTIDLGVNHALGNAAVVAFQTATALSVTGRPGYDQVVARAVPGVSQATLVSRIRALPGLPRYQVQTGSQLATSQASAAVHFTRQFTTAILVFALVSLVVAAIVIANTFRILAAQRTRELALLRCVGATRRQVFAGMLVEALATGAAASAAGVAAGLGFAWGLEHVFAAFGAPIPSGPLVLTLPTAAIAAAVGVGVTGTAALFPAWAATRVAPVTALGSRAEPRVSRAIGWRRLGLAVLFGVAGLTLTWLGMRHVDGAGGFVEIAAGGCVFFLAVLALGPLIAPPVIAFFGWLPGRLLGTTARLATVNARRNPHRVAATTAALTIGITLMTVFTVIASSAQASATAEIQQHYPFDYTVQAGGREGTQLVPGRIVRALQDSPALGVVAPAYAQQSQVNGAAESVGAISPAGLAVVTPPMSAGSLAALRPGTAAVDAGQLGKLGTRQGGTVLVDTSSAGPLRLRVVAVYKGADSPLPAVMVSAPDYLRGFHPSGAVQVFVNRAPGSSAAAARAAVNRATASDPVLEVLTVADYKSALSARVNKLLALFACCWGWRS